MMLTCFGSSRVLLLFVKRFSHTFTCTFRQSFFQVSACIKPLLFLLYINDLPNSSEKLLFHLFADDSNTYYCSKDIDLIHSTVNNELKYVSQWLCANRLNIGPYVIFHSPKKKPYKHITICIDDKPISEVTSVKCLGILMINQLQSILEISHS